MSLLSEFYVTAFLVGSIASGQMLFKGRKQAMIKLIPHSHGAVTNLLLADLCSILDGNNILKVGIIQLVLCFAELFV